MVFYNLLIMNLIFCLAIFVFMGIEGFSSHELSDQLNTNYNSTEYSSPLSVNESPQCPEKQHWQICTAHCAKNCNNFRESNYCRPVCVSGCVCDTGYVFDSTGNCIPPLQCQQRDDVNSYETEDFCPPKEEFSPCLAHCQRNCINWSDPSLPCLKICSPGCTCKKGMVRGPHGTCIRLRQCPPRKFLREQEMVEIECPVDEHFDHCSAHCQKKCSNWNETIPCPRICVSGCICDRGMVRGPTGQCIFSEKCSSQEGIPKNETDDESTVICPDDEHRSEFMPLGYSSRFCIHRNRCFIDFCPPSYFNGCVCDNGLSRGPENRCTDSRLKAKANELLFMHESPYAVHDESNSAIVIEDSETASSTVHPEVRDSRVQGNCNLTALSTEDLVQSLLNDSEKYKIDLNFDCSNRESCLEWCMTRGIGNGDCIEYQIFKSCVCLQHLE